eukprot:TRINITY_DN25619_c0_g3_i1.p1 TRINITY_DN25619_c0_g3~~TRINITY_DN25619_c0_g3_i1.p1  ORF type:complete len:820 (-),score=138.00 TRINITY_DN25619_c0_g3_i1:829-3288(-)
MAAFRAPRGQQVVKITIDSSSSQDEVVQAEVSSLSLLGGHSQPPVRFHGYRRGRELGRGASGQVFLCKRRGSSESYAVKTVDLRRLQLSDNPERDETRLRREVEILSRLPPHENIVRMFDLFEQDHWLLIVLELMGGGDLFTALTSRAQSRLHEQEAVFVVKQLVAGLQFLHEHGVIHRDLKLENVMIASTRCQKALKLYTVKLADFSLAATLWEGASRAFSLVGTRPYTAPEVLEEKSHDRRSDLWCLGVLVYVLLVGRFPFDRMAPAQTELDNIISSMHAPPGARAWCRSILHLDPASRASLSMLATHNWLVNDVPPDRDHQQKRRCRKVIDVDSDVVEPMQQDVVVDVEVLPEFANAPYASGTCRLLRVLLQDQPATHPEANDEASAGYALTSLSRASHQQSNRRSHTVASIRDGRARLRPGKYLFVILAEDARSHEEHIRIIHESDLESAGVFTGQEDSAARDAFVRHWSKDMGPRDPLTGSLIMYAGDLEYIEGTGVTSWNTNLGEPDLMWKDNFFDQPNPLSCMAVDDDDSMQPATYAQPCQSREVPSPPMDMEMEAALKELVDFAGGGSASLPTSQAPALDDAQCRDDVVDAPMRDATNLVDEEGLLTPLPQHDKSNAARSGPIPMGAWTPFAVESAEVLLSDVQAPSALPDVMQVHMFIADRLAGHILGRNGSKIQCIAEAVGCPVWMTPRRNKGSHPAGERRVVVVGTFKQCKTMQELVHEQMAEALQADWRDIEAKVALLVRAEAAGMVTGKQGFVLQQIRKQSGVTMQLLKDEMQGQRPCVLSGPLTSILKAEKHVFDLVKAVPPTAR